MRPHVALLGLAVAAAANAAAAQETGWEAAARGYAARDGAEAIAAFEAAIGSGELAPDQARDVRLALADARLAAGQPDGALKALAPLDVDYDVAARRAFALDALGRRAEASEAYAAAERQAEPDARLAMRLGRIYALGAQDAVAAAGAARGLENMPGLSAEDALNIAYIAVGAGDDRQAGAFFARADAARPLGDAALLDAAYSARRAGDEAAAVRYLKRALAQAVRRSDGAEDSRFALRRELTDLTRRTGAYASILVDDVGGRLPGAGAGTIQAGMEAYVRPLGLNDGRPVELFARAFQTLDAGPQGAEGTRTLQGWVGARAKPLKSQNLVLEASRMVALGRDARDAWMVRAAWSATANADRAPERTDGLLAQAYADVAHVPDDNATFAVADVRLGRRLTVGDGPWFAAPFVGAAFAFDSGRARESAVGAGPGLWLRGFFREDALHAPRSQVDFVVQYRLRIAGDRRAEGVFASFSISY